MSTLWQLDSIRECQVVPNDAFESQKTRWVKAPALLKEAKACIGRITLEQAVPELKMY